MTNQKNFEDLVDKYPKIFRDRHGDMRHTAMVWGFECGIGWYDIIDRTCRLIQSHIDHINKHRQFVLRHNEMREQILRNDYTLFDEEFAKCSEAYRELQRTSIPNQNSLNVPNEIPQLIASQIKEKFGTLRFYYDGGDGFCAGVIDMAETMSAITCETCGNPGKLAGGSWLYTTCKEHLRDGDTYYGEENDDKVDSDS